MWWCRAGRCALFATPQPPLDHAQRQGSKTYGERRKGGSQVHLTARRPSNKRAVGKGEGCRWWDGLKKGGPRWQGRRAQKECGYVNCDNENPARRTLYSGRSGEQGPTGKEISVVQAGSSCHNAGSASSVVVAGLCSRCTVCESRGPVATIQNPCCARGESRVARFSACS